MSFKRSQNKKEKRIFTLRLDKAKKKDKKLYIEVKQGHIKEKKNYSTIKDNQKRILH